MALRICILLLDKPRTIAELQRELNLTRHQVNERLRRLRECNVVGQEREGRWLTFHVHDAFEPALNQLLSLDQTIEFEFTEPAPLDSLP